MPVEFGGSGNRKAGDALKEAFGVLINGDGTKGYGGWRELGLGDGRRIFHGEEGPGQALALMEGMVSGQGVEVGDETGSVGVGPQGLRISKSGQDGWALNIGPAGAGFQKGQFRLGGQWSPVSQGASVGYGPLSLEGGYGVAPVRAPEGTLPPEGGPSGWGQLKVQLGNSPMPVSDERAAAMARESMGGPPKPSASGLASPARLEFEQEQERYRQVNPDWWRVN